MWILSQTDLSNICKTWENPHTLKSFNQNVRSATGKKKVNAFFHRSWECWIMQLGKTGNNSVCLKILWRKAAWKVRQVPLPHIMRVSRDANRMPSERRHWGWGGEKDSVWSSKEKQVVFSRRTVVICCLQLKQSDHKYGQSSRGGRFSTSHTWPGPSLRRAENQQGLSPGVLSTLTLLSM